MLTKAITTRFVGPTNTRGARIIASDLDGNRVTVSYNYQNDAHDVAVRELCRKMGWRGKLIAGALKNGRVYVWLHDDAVEV